MKKLFLTVLINASCLIVFGQQQASIKRDAQLMADAFVKGDLGNTVAYIYPKVLDKWGGKQQVLKNSKEFSARLLRSGLAINSIIAGEPGKIQTIGSREFCLLNSRVSVNANGTVMSNNLGAIAVSEDKGRKWYFISAGMVSDETLFQFFPEIRGKISIPKTAMPMMPGTE